MSDTETSPQVDLKSFFDLQKRYLQGTLQKSDDPNLNEKIISLQTELDTINNIYDNSNITNADLLTKQKQVSNILDEEKNRLMSQKSTIDSEYVVKQRQMQFNNSYSLRQHEVNKMMAVIVFGLFVITILILVQRHLGFIPESAMTIAAVAIISIVGIYSIKQILKILLRSNMDFTKLYLDEPEELKKKSAADSDASDLLAANDLDYCVGPACCHEGTSFDNEQLLCVPNEDVEEVEEAEEVEEVEEAFSNLQPAMCNTPYEQDKYAKI